MSVTRAVRFGVRQSLVQIRVGLHADGRRHAGRDNIRSLVGQVRVA